MAQLLQHVWHHKVLSQDNLTVHHQLHVKQYNIKDTIYRNIFNIVRFSTSCLDCPKINFVPHVVMYTSMSILLPHNYYNNTMSIEDIVKNKPFQLMHTTTNNSTVNTMMMDLHRNYVIHYFKMLIVIYSWHLIIILDHYFG